MPMHDWTRIDPNEFRTFHGRWIYAITDALNGGLLPADYYAMADFSLRTVIPDVLTLHTPDPGAAPAGGAGVATAAPRTWFATTERLRPRTRTRHVAVRTARNHAVVAILEIVSPGNKAKRKELRGLVTKVVGALEAGVHVLIADPFPPGPHDPDGIHAAVWRVATGRTFSPPPDKPLTLAAYSAPGDGDVGGFVEPIAVGDALRPMPLFLEPEAYVNLPLEETYQVAWNAFPAGLRAVVAGA